MGYGQKQALTHLPLIDCLSYKQGNDINEKMKIPDGAVSDSVTIMMEFEKEGKKYFLTPIIFQLILIQPMFISTEKK